MKKLSFDEGYLTRFKVIHGQTLFEPQWENLNAKRCVLCGNKLKFPLKGVNAICTSKKHRYPFIINKNKL